MLPLFCRHNIRFAIFFSRNRRHCGAGATAKHSEKCCLLHLFSSKTVVASCLPFSPLFDVRNKIKLECFLLTTCESVRVCVVCVWPRWEKSVVRCLLNDWPGLAWVPHTTHKQWLLLQSLSSCYFYRRLLGTTGNCHFCHSIFMPPSPIDHSGRRIFYLISS